MPFNLQIIRRKNLRKSISINRHSSRDHIMPIHTRGQSQNSETPHPSCTLPYSFLLYLSIFLPLIMFSTSPSHLSSLSQHLHLILVPSHPLSSIHTGTDRYMQYTKHNMCLHAYLSCTLKIFTCRN